MELIDADLCKRRLMKFIPNNDVAFDILADMPRIDIVRCKDCKHHRMFQKRDMCAKNAVILDNREVALRRTNADDFCSYGERKK